MNNKILFLVPDGVGIRNYLYSDVIKNLKSQAEIVFWSPLPENAFNEVFEIHNCNFEVEPIILEKESFLTRIFKESATYARLHSNSKKVDNLTVLDNWNYKPKGVKRNFLNVIAEFVGLWASKKYSRILYLEQQAKKHWKSEIIEKYKTKLKQLQPKTIFITHQRVSSLMPICIAAKELGINVVSVIYSWDNIPKARLAVEADIYLAWSNYMKREMLLFYPEIGKEKIVVSGTPQFEFYQQEKRIINRENFAKKYGLDSSKLWICFSGDDIKTSPYDQQYLEAVLKAISDLKTNTKPQVIFRRCPVDFSDRYDAVLKAHENVIAIDPLWYVPNSNDNWGAFLPKYNDVDLQVNLAYHCIAVINLGSTMAHDFAIFNKPCFYLNYDPVVDKNWSVNRIYKYQHFRSIGGLRPVEFFNSEEDIILKLQKLLSSSEDLAIDKKQWFEIVNLHPLDISSKIITDVLLNQYK